MSEKQVERWFFYNSRAHKTTWIDAPQLHPGFQGWRKGKQPCVLIDGVLQFGRKLRAIQTDNECNTACKRATEPWCQCSCRGKNHGIENAGTSFEIAEKDVVEVAA